MITENYIEVSKLCCLDTGEIVRVSAIIDALRKLGEEVTNPPKCTDAKYVLNMAEVTGKGITPVSSVVRCSKIVNHFPAENEDPDYIQVQFDCIFDYDPTQMMQTTASDGTTKIAKTDIKIEGFGSGSYVLDAVHMDCVIDGIDFLPRCVINNLPAMSGNMTVTFEQQAVGLVRQGRAVLSGYFFARDGEFGMGSIYP